MNTDRLRNGLFDLTHLEINTIVKSNMTASKITNSPRKLLYELSKTYHFELVFLGAKYSTYFADFDNKKELFREASTYRGSGYYSFKELSTRAETSKKWLTGNKTQIHEVDDDEILEDAMMLERIILNCNEIKTILKKRKQQVTDSDGKKNDKFDTPSEMKDFFNEKDHKKVIKDELDLYLDELLSLKKMNDIGTEKILTQTVIGIDGDITTRISKTFANNPISFINETHQEAITLSVNYWSSLVTIFTNFISKLKS